MRIIRSSSVTIDCVECDRACPLVCVRARARHALMMRNRYRGHHYRGLTTPGAARRCVADQFCREPRRRPINVTTTRRLTLARAGCARLCACVCACFASVHVLFALNTRAPFRSARCRNGMDFTMVLGSSFHLADSLAPTVTFYGYRLYERTIWTAAIFRPVLNQCLIRCGRFLAGCQSVSPHREYV